jgi:hypothetical protein
VLNSDVDVDGDVLSATLLGGPTNGELAFFANGAFIFTPTLNFNGAVTFTYGAFDGSLSTQAVVTLTVNPVNDAPLAASDAYTTAEDTPLVIAAPGLLANDSDIDDDPLAAILDQAPLHGGLALDPDGSFVYTPTANYNGPDFFAYRANDGQYNSNIASFRLTVNPVNEVPLAAADFYTTTARTLLVVAAPGLLANDSDIEGGPLAVTLLSGPQHGSLALQADGSFTYLPAPGFRGVDQFTYQASDGLAVSASVTVTIQVLSGPMPYRMYIPAAMQAYLEQEP